MDGTLRGMMSRGRAPGRSGAVTLYPGTAGPEAGTPNAPRPFDGAQDRRAQDGGWRGAQARYARARTAAFTSS